MFGVFLVHSWRRLKFIWSLILRIQSIDAERFVFVSLFLPSDFCGFLSCFTFGDLILAWLLFFWNFHERLRHSTHSAFTDFRTVPRYIYSFPMKSQATQFNYLFVVESLLLGFLVFWCRQRPLHFCLGVYGNYFL